MGILTYNRSYTFYFLILLLGVISCSNSKTRNDKSNQIKTSRRPNILFALADDASWPFFGAYGSHWLKTPNFDRVARQGILFMNAYTPNAKCAPSRATIITGRNSWQLGAAANHVAYFPAKYKTYVEVLKNHGYDTGYTGKPWGPGKPGMVNGHRRLLVGQPYQKMREQPPTKDMSSVDYAANFKQFLNQKPQGKPFCFWYGGHEPHRTYKWRSGIVQGGMKKSQIKNIPAFLPDNDTVRTDMLDYGYEVEHFDKHLGRMIMLLKKRGKLKNTLVVVTGDNGIPFPGAKGQEYEYSNHMPLAIMWPKGIKNPGRKVTDFVSFIDFAPTFLQVAGINPKDTPMQSITGRSLMDIFKSGQSGRVDSTRDYVLIGKERHDIGRPHDWGYPIRGIITDNYCYLHNFKTNRWPGGNPETGYMNIDRSPTKTWILYHRKDPKYTKYWRHSMGKRGANELYNNKKDPANMVNLVGKKENARAYQDIEHRLRRKLFNRLKTQGDPRMFGNGQVFEKYPYAKKKFRHFYKKYMNGKLDKSDVGWTVPSDYESKHPLK